MRWTLALPFVALLVSTVYASEPKKTEFSNRAEALPFPPDVRELEFDATFDDIEFTSGSSLPALVDFYRRELAKRGWAEDPSAVEIETDSAELTFTHDGVEILVEFDKRSDGVQVSFDCEGLDFAGTSDPAALIAAGVPQPRAYVFLQKHVARPTEIQDMEYSNDSCHFKSKLGLPEVFDFFNKQLKSQGWRESRKPIVTADRRYTEFQRGPDEVSVNVFAHEIGSRVVLGYETTAREPLIPPLAEVGPLATTDKTPASDDKPAPPRVMVDVSKNTGTANIVLEGKRYTFKHAAAFRTKQNGDSTTQLLFTDRPIPLAHIQELLVTQDDASIDDIFGENWPSYIRISVGEYTSFSFNSGGIGVGNSIDDPVNDLKVEKNCITGTLKTGKPLDVFDDVMTIEVSIDAALLTPETALSK